MNRTSLFLISLMCVVLVDGSTQAAGRKLNCSGFDPKAETRVSRWNEPANGSCSVRTLTLDGVSYAAPDKTCTPGATNPTLTLSVLQHKGFKTKCERDKATSASRKAATYVWYGITKPSNNTGQRMVCELDHLISIEIGGADTIDNIWPQCGPSRVVLKNRYFKQKDLVEDYLADQVRAGNMDLKDVQKGIAADWTQYLNASRAYWKSHKQPKDGG